MARCLISFDFGSPLSLKLIWFFFTFHIAVGLAFANNTVVSFYLCVVFFPLFFSHFFQIQLRYILVGSAISQVANFYLQCSYIRAKRSIIFFLCYVGY